MKAAPRGALVAPRMFEAARGGTGELILSWADPNDVTLTGYQYRYRNPDDSNWSPDWTDMPGSDATTTTHTLTDLEWEVLYTIQLRTVRGNMMGPGAETQGTPPEDLSRPSIVRGMVAVNRGDAEILVSFLAPVRSGDADIIMFEYRYAQGSTVPTNTAWEEMPDHLVAHRFFFVRELVNGELYTFEVRAVNGNNKTGPAEQARATPCCVPGTTVTEPPPLPPSEPTSISATVPASATSKQPYTTLVEVNGLPARVAYVDVIVKWEPAADHGNAVLGYEYRMAEGGSIPSSAPWVSARNDYHTRDELALTEPRLKPGTRYTFEVRTVSSNGVSANTAIVTVSTPRFDGPHYTMSAPGSASEGQDVTITVRRTNTGDGASTALVQVRDSFDGVNEIIRVYAVEFGSSDTRATVTYTIEDDGQNLAGRQVMLRVGHVGGGARDTITENTYSVEWHTVAVRDTTP